MRYESVSDRDWNEIRRDVTGSDERRFVDALRTAAYHRTANEFNELLTLVADRALSTTEQWSIAEAIIVMVQARHVVPDRARSTLLAMETFEPATASRAEALELINQRQSS